MHLVSYHKCRIESQSEMANHLVVICLILIFFQEIRSSRKSNLRNIFFYFLSRHSKTRINEFQGFLFRIYNNFYLCLIFFRKRILSHHLQLFQLRNGIASV